MNVDDYRGLDAVALAECIARGDCSASEVLEAAIARCEAVNPGLRAVVTPMYEQGRADAAAPAAGPLSGVPFLLKDLGAEYGGVATTQGSRLFREYVPPRDDELVHRYRSAGLVVFGKTACPEMGLTTGSESALFGATRNPHDPTRSAGGSSSGAAAAVAAGIVPAAHASDGGGSIRVPASACGLFGLKPTRGRVVGGGLVQDDGWAGMSAHHAITRSVRDSAALLDAVSSAGADGLVPAPPVGFVAGLQRAMRPLRIGLQTRAFNGVSVEAACRAAAEDAASLCQQLGHEVREVHLQVDFERLARAAARVICVHTRRALHARARQLGRTLEASDVEHITWLLAEAAEGTGAGDYLDAVQDLRSVEGQVHRFFRSVDVLLTPTVAVETPPFGPLSLSNESFEQYVAETTRGSAFVQLFNVAGTPAMSVPLCWRTGALPMGVQFAAPWCGEGTLLGLALQLEQARPWAGRLPL